MGLCCLFVFGLVCLIVMVVLFVCVCAGLLGICVVCLFVVLFVGCLYVSYVFTDSRAHMEQHGNIKHKLAVIKNLSVTKNIKFIRV